MAQKEVYTLVQAPDSTLWAGTSAGLIHINPATGTATAIRPGQSATPVEAIHCPDPNTLIAAGHNGLCIINTRTRTARRMLAGIRVRHITPDPDRPGHLWCATTQGIFLADTRPDTPSCTRIADGYFVNLITTGPLLLAAHSWNGILAIDRNTLSHKWLDAFATDQVKMLATEADTLYAATNGAGIRIAHLPTGHICRTISATDPSATSLASNAVYSLLLTPATLFAGTYMAGLSHTPRHTPEFSTLHPQAPSGLHTAYIRAFYPDPHTRHSYIGTRQGFVHLAPDRTPLFSADHTNSPLSVDLITMIAPVGLHILIGTYGGGLYRYTPATHRLMPFDCGTSNGAFGCYAAPSDTSIWVGSSAGLFHISPATGTYRRFTPDNSPLPSVSIFSLMATSNGRLLIGTASGVCQANPDGSDIRPIQWPDSAAAILHSVRCIYQDPNSRIWLCDDSRGVVVPTPVCVQYAYSPPPASPPAQ